MSILTVTLASVLIAVSAVCAAWQFAQLRALKQRATELELAGGVSLRLPLISLLYGVWNLVRVYRVILRCRMARDWHHGCDLYLGCRGLRCVAAVVSRRRTRRRDM